MKSSILISFLLLLSYYGNTCTIIPAPFCMSLDNSSDQVILTGVIVSIDDTGIDMEVLEVLRGEESRDTIRIWDGIDFDCNGLWSMSASDIGNLHDTIVIILHKITVVYAEWAVIGDYGRPDPHYDTPELKLKAGNVEGFISGSAIAPEHQKRSMNYEAFKNIVMDGGECAEISTSVNDNKIESIITVNNPFDSRIYIQLNKLVNKGHVKLYSLTGHLHLIQEFHSESSLELAIQNIPSGMYLLEVYTDRSRELIKVIKQSN